jgi:hypothetical protein
MEAAEAQNWDVEPQGEKKEENPSSRTMALGSTQPLTEMSTRNIPGLKKLPARNLSAINVGASTSRKPKGHHGLYGNKFTFFLTLCIHITDPFFFLQRYGE